MRYAIKQAVHDGCDAIVQVGDWGFTWPGYQTNHSLHKLNKMLGADQMPMFFLDGNHENYGDLQKRGFWDATKLCVFDDAEFVTYIPRGHVWEWQGCSFMALGGAFSIDQEQRIEGRSWWREELITFADQVRCGVNLDLHGKPIDIFLSHDCPAGVNRLETHLELTSKSMGVDYKLDRDSRANRTALWQVVELAKPKLLIHGHYHYAYTDVLRWDGHEMQVAGLACDGMGNSYTIIDTDKYA